MTPCCRCGGEAAVVLKYVQCEPGVGCRHYEVGLCLVDAHEQSRRLTEKLTTDQLRQQLRQLVMVLDPDTRVAWLREMGVSIG